MNRKTSDDQPRSARLQNFRHDLFASVVVFLVALPLCMGIAIASGVPVAAGLFTGIVGGLVVGSLGGSPLQVSGPAAGLVVIVFDLVQRFGVERLGIIVLIAGLLQIIAGLLKLGQWFRAVSPAVIKGMLAGIGVIIFSSQFHVMLDDKPKGNVIQDLAAIPIGVAKAITLKDFVPREERQFRSKHLELMVHLRGEQQAVYEQVQALLPTKDSEPEEMAKELEEQIAIKPPGWDEITEHQREIAERIQKISEVVKEFESTIGSERSARIVAAVTNSEEAMSRALQDLESVKLLESVQSQSQLVLSLDEYLAALKNHSLAAQLGLLTILTIILWPLLAPIGLRVAPAPLVAVILATTIAFIFSLPVLYVVLPSNLLGEINLPDASLLRDVSLIGLFQAGAVIAAVGSAETLLCATATDQLHHGPRAKYNQELFAQGVGNTICGILGALPLTGVIVRSSANIQAGGRTRLSAVLHGLWLLVFIAAFAWLLNAIPTSALAAILVYTGYKLVNPESVRELAKFGWSEVSIFAATVLTIVVFGLLTGVITGFGLAIVKLLYRLSRLNAVLTTTPNSDSAQLILSGSATFLGLPHLATRLEQVPAGAKLRVYFRDLDYIDHACIDLLQNWAEQHEATGGQLRIDWDSLQAKHDEDIVAEEEVVKKAVEEVGETI